VVRPDPRSRRAVDVPAGVGRRHALAGGVAVVEHGDTMPTTFGRRQPPPPLGPRTWLRYDLISRAVARIRPESILDVGCGQGSIGVRLAERARYLGVEPDARAAAVARSRIVPRGGTVLDGDHRAVPDGTHYDVVCAFEVLEHLDDDAAMLAVWASSVRPGGHLLVTVPAWPERFGPMDVTAGHLRRYTPEQLTALLRGAGLEPARISLYGWPIAYVLERIRNTVDAVALAREPAAVGTAERTARSGRRAQPNQVLGAASAAAVTPFRYLQRLAPRRGVGLVALARRPGTAAGHHGPHDLGSRTSGRPRA
jgi:SAM-dependent methyltransferase